MHREPTRIDQPRSGVARRTRRVEVAGVVAAVLFALATCPSLAQRVHAESTADTPSAGQPYLSLRDASLTYNGTTEDLTTVSELRIGWFGPSDSEDPLTGDIWWTATYAVDEANASASPDDRPFRLIPRWSVDPWGTGVSQLARMVYEERPVALVGSIDSASTHLAEQVVAKANLPLVSPIVTDPSVNLAGVSWMFSCAPSDDAIAQALVDGLLGTAETTPPRDPLVLVMTTDHASRMTARAILRALSTRGRLPDFRFELPPGSTDVAERLGTALDSHPGSLLVVAGPDDSAQIVRTVRAHLGNVPIFGGPGCARHRFLEQAGVAAEGVLCPRLFDADAQANPVAAEYIARFSAARGHAPDYAAAFTYDAMRLLIQATRNAGPDRPAVREALATLSPWRGTTGPIDFDQTGQNRRSNLGLACVSNGRVAPLAPHLAAPGIDARKAGIASATSPTPRNSAP